MLQSVEGAGADPTVRVLPQSDKVSQFDSLHPESRHTALRGVFSSSVDESSTVAVIDTRFVRHSIIVIVTALSQRPADIPKIVSCVTARLSINLRPTSL